MNKHSMTLDDIADAWYGAKWADLPRAKRHRILTGARPADIDVGYICDDTTMRTDLTEDELLASVRLTLNPYKTWRTPRVIGGEYLTNGIMFTIGADLSERVYGRYAKRYDTERSTMSVPTAGALKKLIPKSLRNYHVAHYAGYYRHCDGPYAVYTLKGGERVAFNSCIVAALRRELPDARLLGCRKTFRAGLLVEGDNIRALIMPIRIEQFERDRYDRLARP